MPIVSMFYGIVVRMFADDHNPPHIHVAYQSEKAVYTFDGECPAGKLPRKQHTLVVAWIMLHQEELQAAWTVCHGGEQPMRIEPLR
ncbi:DUF4160 domain-containing protein [Bifidobacterium callimiconis]|uniref:DUF4160 domain-containing protein n=1 Tax=Bifidobacterium callimiconis TaxID=2306973 RepID=UPI001BDBD8E4|nr:DUF4160 domain-containing protein [Bifidobacterium callimiconis]MBT1176959.1 DUF4160 domain-containing protein [Bifidobacterium callimiconis]